MTLNQRLKDMIVSVLTLDGDKIVWKSRTPEFYAAHFTRVYDAQGAADSWNSKRAGTPPRWRYTTARGDFMCYAHLTLVSLVDICAALGVDYAAQRKKVGELTTQKDVDELHKIIRNCVELNKKGEPHWKRRTKKTHPKTSQEKLDEFNRDFAGRIIKPRKADGKYRIAYRLISHDDLIRAVKAKETK